jgi:hypothetical protein
MLEDDGESITDELDELGVAGVASKYLLAPSRDKRAEHAAMLATLHWCEAIRDYMGGALIDLRFKAVERGRERDELREGLREALDLADGTGGTECWGNEEFAAFNRLRKLAGLEG